MRHILVVALIYCVVGCATTAPLSTPSQRPEVTIEGGTRKAVLDILVAEMLSKGFQIRQVSEYNAVFGKRDDRFLSQLLLGSRYDSVPEARMNFSLVESGNAVRVFGSAAMVTNPGSGFERVMDMTDGNAKHDLQAMLERLKYRVQGGPSYVQQPVEQSSAGSTQPRYGQQMNRKVEPDLPSPAKTGKYAFEAERIATGEACKPTTAASLAASGPGFENYTVPCAGGDALTIRCDFSNCRVLK